MPRKNLNHFSIISYFLHNIYFAYLSGMYFKLLFMPVFGHKTGTFCGKFQKYQNEIFLYVLV